MKQALMRAVLAARFAAAYLVSCMAVYAAPAGAQEMDGKALFLKNCAACHQPTGKGIPGAFPALAGNKFVQGKGSEVATVLLKGRGGMPDFSGSLNDRDIATVLSFVRSSWGNQAEALSEPDVSALRDALGVQPYSNAQMANKH